MEWEGESERERGPPLTHSLAAASAVSAGTVTRDHLSLACAHTCTLTPLTVAACHGFIMNHEYFNTSHNNIKDSLGGASLTLSQRGREWWMPSPLAPCSHFRSMWMWVSQNDRCCRHPPLPRWGGCQCAQPQWRDDVKLGFWTEKEDENWAQYLDNILYVI